MSRPDQEGAAPGRRWPRFLAVGALATYVAVASTPSLFAPLRRGVDESWIWAINDLAGSAFVFGRDVLFTYGPLGYLLYPAPDEGTFPLAAGFMLLSQLSLLGILLFRYWRSRAILSLLGFVILYLMAAGIGLQYEYRLLIILAAILMVGPGERKWRAWTVLAACLAAALLYVKLNVGLAAAAALALGGLAWWRERRIGAREALLLLGGVYIVAVVILSFLVLDGPRNLLPWFRGGWDILSGYAEAMALPIPGGVVPLAIASVLILLGTAVWIGRIEGQASVAALPLTAILVVAVRHAFTRHEGRPFFGVAVAGMAALILIASSRRGVIRGVVGAALLLPVAMAGSGTNIGTHVAAGFDPRPGWRTLLETTRLQETRLELEASTELNLVDDLLPRSIGAQIRDRTVDSLPVALTFLLANDLAWIPNPVLQTYQAYVSRLDHLVASHFAGSSAPPFLLYQFTDIDQRHPILATPAAWRSILRHYRLGTRLMSSGPSARSPCWNGDRLPLRSRSETWVAPKLGSASGSTYLSRKRWSSPRSTWSPRSSGGWLLRSGGSNPYTSIFGTGTAGG